MNSLMKHIYSLSVTIGPRGTTSKNEKKAATYIKNKLDSYGYNVSTESFNTVTSFSTVQLIFITGYILCWPIFLNNPLLAALLSTALLVFYILDINTLYSISTFLPKKQSQNIRARYENANHPKTKVVIMAHYDSSRTAINFHPKLVKGFRKSFFTLFYSMAIFTFMSWIGVFFAQVHLLLFWLMGPFTLIFTGIFLTLIHRELFGKFTKGANDNASGMAVMLEIAKSCAQNPPANLEIEFLATGAEEAGTFGILDYINKHRIGNKYFVNLDNLGAGDLFVTSKEGILKKYPTDKKLLNIISKVSKEEQFNISTAPYHLLTTDLTPILARKGKGISIMAKDKQGLLPNWHWNTDTIDNIDPGNLSLAKNLIMKVITELEQD